MNIYMKVAQTCSMKPMKALSKFGSAFGETANGLMEETTALFKKMKRK